MQTIRLMADCSMPVPCAMHNLYMPSLLLNNRTVNRLRQWLNGFGNSLSSILAIISTMQCYASTTYAVVMCLSVTNLHCTKTAKQRIMKNNAI